MPTGRSPRTLLPVVLGFVLLGVAGASAIVLSVLQDRAVAWVRHTLEVENEIDAANQLALQAEASQRGFMLTANPVFETQYRLAASRLPAMLATVRRSVADNPRELANVRLLAQQIAARLIELERRTALVHAGQPRAAVAMLDRPSRAGTLRGINQIVTAMMAEERRLFELRAGRARRLAIATRLVLAGSLLLVTLFAVWSLAETKRRIARLTAAYKRLGQEAAERGAAEAQLRQLQKMESLGQLTGGIAHDFNNMLAVVIGSLDLAERRLTGNEHRGLASSLANAMEASKRAATLTARLLAFSRRQPLEPEVLDANKLVHGMSELLRRTLGETILIETVLAGGLWRTFADAAQLESAVLNLAVNARDAMPDGGKLTIETANCELDERYCELHSDLQPGHYVLVSISDTGTGMPASVAERAFDPFYTTKEVGKGTGLGLSQVHGFVKQSRGHVAIYSEPGEGTSIKIYLPRHHGAGAQDGAASLAPGCMPGGSRECVILVAEDEARVRHMTVDALRELGYTVVAAGDGTEALEQLVLQPRVDLLFTDIVMPGMNGRQLADRASALKPGLRVLYTTGYTRNAIVHNGVVDAGLSLITKPFSIDALARKVRDVLDA